MIIANAYIFNAVKVINYNRFQRIGVQKISGYLCTHGFKETPEMLKIELSYTKLLFKCKNVRKFGERKI